MKRQYGVDSEYEESESDRSSGYGHYISAHHSREFNNHIHFRGHITADGCDHFINRVISLANNLALFEIRTGIAIPLKIFIDTEGGEVHPALKLYDVIKRLPVKVITIIEGYCASAGTIISLAGDERLITPNSFWMIHQLSFGAGGKLKRVREELQNASRVQEKMKDIYRAHFKINEDELKELLESDKELPAEEAVRIGLCIDIYKERLCD